MDGVRSKLPRDRIESRSDLRFRPPYKLHLGMRSTHEPHVLRECVAGTTLKFLKTPVRPDVASDGDKFKDQRYRSNE